MSPSVNASPSRLARSFRGGLLGTVTALAACGGHGAADARYPERPSGCSVQLFRGKVAGLVYDDIGRVDTICNNDLAEASCLDELRNQTCKLGGDVVYDVPEQPERPSPDRVRYTGRVAHTRAAGLPKKPAP
jgi:hypothetical protein